MILIAIVTVLILAAGVAADIVDRHEGEAIREFCENECENYKRIYR